MDVAMEDSELKSTKALGNHLVIEEANILAEGIIKNTRGREIPPWTKVPVPERTNMGILGQITPKVRALDEKEESKTSDFDKG